MIYCMKNDFCPFTTVSSCYTIQNDFHFVKNSESGVLEVFMNQEHKQSGRCKIGENPDEHKEKFRARITILPKERHLEKESKLLKDMVRLQYEMQSFSNRYQNSTAI